MIIYQEVKRLMIRRLTHNQVFVHVVKLLAIQQVRVISKSDVYKYFLNNRYIKIKLSFADPPQKRPPHHELEKIDPGTKSEGEDDSQHGVIKCKATLGKTPNHLTLRSIDKSVYVFIFF